MFRDSPNEDRSLPPAPGLHARLERAARSFAYPPAPNIAVRERQRVQQHRRNIQNGGQRRRGAARYVPARIAWALAALALLSSLLLVSPVRARVVEWLRVGAVQIFLEATPDPAALTPPAVLIDLGGETTLARAAEQVPFRLRLPAYPPDLQAPQRVYHQQINGTSVVIFVWLQPEDPREVRLALYQIGEGDVFQKQLIQNVEETTVNGDWAMWVEGPYLLTTSGGQIEERRIIRGRTLIWSAAGRTYRLETDLPLAEARKIAESLREWEAK